MDKKQDKLEVAGFKQMPDFMLWFKENEKSISIGLYSHEGKEGFSRKNPITIPAGVYLHLFKVDPVKYKEFRERKAKTA
jgi:hypothetical protein